MKTCRECGLNKPKTEFPSKGRGRLKSRCKLCSNAIARNKYYPGTDRNRFLRRVYGISLEQYQEMLENQGRVCAICGQPETNAPRGTVASLAVDHDHDTGAIRGLLCSNCNRAIGLMRDNPELLRAAADYLEVAPSRPSTTVSLA